MIPHKEMQAAETAADPHEEMERAEKAASAALVALARAAHQYVAAYKMVAGGAYDRGGGGESGSRHRFGVSSSKIAPYRFAQRLCRRMRRLGLGGILTQARVR